MAATSGLSSPVLTVNSIISAHFQIFFAIVEPESPPDGALAIESLPFPPFAKGKKWSGTSDLRIRAVGALSECFFRLKDIYQPQGGESRPRFSARAHAVGSRVDCLGPRFGPHAVEPPERNNRFHFGCEGERSVF